MDHMRKKRGERQASWIQSTMRRSPLTDRRMVATGSEEGPKASSNRSTKTICPFRIFRRASATPNQAARSISGKVRRRPERGGHSISKVLLRMSAGSQDRRIAVAFDGPRLNDLAAQLSRLAERQEISLRVVSSLFGEFAPSGG
jgi:hypothetical protein